MSDLLLKGVSLAGVSSCHLRQSSRAKRMRIELRPDRSLLIVIPGGTREDQWLTFVLSKRAWIERKLQEPALHRPGPAAAVIRFPAIIELLCNKRRYSIRHHAGNQNQARPVAETLNLICTDSSEKQRFQNLRRWLMTQAREEFSERLQVISRSTGLEWNRLSIRGQKTRWGSCSAQGNLSLNFKMLFLPPELVDHVLLHELVHTREMNHSPRFWAMMKKFDPKCDQHRAELRKAGQLLPGWVVKV
ncbi:MAG: SprT family zinc-dependent metalloprotease [Pseudomonadota bacterium]|nr:SprT family zinc-dependent metalloprotease [Pseudomonadota bacterium]